MNKTNVKTKPSTTHRHDTPNNKTHIIKFRVTAKLKRCDTPTALAKLLHLSLSTLIRRAHAQCRRSSAPSSLPAAEKKP